MHAAVQSGGRSPKRSNCPSAMQQLKPNSDNLHNSSTSFPSQVKGKRRDRGDQMMESIKRERTSKVDDGDSAGCKFDSHTIKSELSRILEKGRLISVDGVEKLVHFMQVDNSKKIDLPGRVFLADVIAATDSVDCLNKFMQIGGVPVLDEWLQEAHKGRTGEGNSPKECDKAVEELLLALLRALDKLPINLHALQTCNIGKSVNHLRSHKNLEIQKKARSLVDTWKKRVDAEMKTSDSRPAGNNQAVTWQVKPGLSEVSHVGNQHNGSGEVSLKSSITQQSICKGLSGKSVHLESTKSFVGSGKPQSSSFAPLGFISKDSLLKDGANIGSLDLPQMVAKEERSSSSSHSQNNSQSCSSDHGKTGGSSLKEDARSSTAGSVSKTACGSSRNRRLSNGFISSNISVDLKESISGKSALFNRNSTGEKAIQAGLYCERTIDASPSEHGSGHRLIVRLPNPGRSPTRSTSGGSLEDPPAGSRTSSPGVLEKREHGEHKVTGRNDIGRTHIGADFNAESWLSNDAKEGVVGCDEGDRLPMIVPDEVQRDEATKVMEAPATMCSLSGNNKFTSAEPTMKDSFSSMNALIESCAKYSESTTPLSGDDVGMNLLASVATGEMPKSNVVSPASSALVSSTAAVEDPGNGTNETRTRFSSGDLGSQNLSMSDGNTRSDSLKLGKNNSPVFEKDDKQMVAANFSDSKVKSYREDSNQSKGDPRICGIVTERLKDCKSAVSSPVDQIKSSNSSHEKIDCEVEAAVIGESSLCQRFDKDLHVGVASTDQKSHSVAKDETELVDRKGDGAPTSSVAEKFSCKLDGSDNHQWREQIECSVSAIVSSNYKLHGGTACAQIVDRASIEKLGEGSNDSDQQQTITREANACPKVSADDEERKEDLVSSVEISSLVSTTVQQEAGTKLNFDLNEGLLGDDVIQSEPISASAPKRISDLSSLPSSPMLNGSPSLVTVAAPAKGFFMPPEIVLKNMGELGWKGSAATSAFRPAEPRRVLEAFSSFDAQPFNIAATKHSHSVLEFDLNVPNDRALEDMASHNSNHTTGSESGVFSDPDVPSRASGGLDLDLNRLDEGAEIVQSVASTRCLLHARPTAVGYSNPETNIFRDFDLNSGPGVDDTSTEPLLRNQKTKKSNNIPFVPPNSGLRMNNAELGSGWFPPGNSYPAVAIPSFLHDRGDQSYPIVAAAGAQRILGPLAGVGAYGSDMYRGNVLSSSPAMAYSPAATAFSYAGFPFGTSFPLASASFTSGSTNYVDSSSGGCSYFPPIASPLIGAGAISSPYTRPYMISHLEGSAVTGSNGGKWGRQGLDLNTGPGCTEEVKDDRLPFSRQLHAVSSQSFVEDQARLFQVAGGMLKRKEPDGSWEPERFNFKHPSWQ